MGADPPQKGGITPVPQSLGEVELINHNEYSSLYNKTQNVFMSMYYYRAGLSLISTRRFIKRPMSSWAAIGRAEPRPTINIRDVEILLRAK